jgi:hypothetical protein
MYARKEDRKCPQHPRAHLTFSQAACAGCAGVQLWLFDQRTARGALVALIPTPAALVRALAWCPHSLSASASPPTCQKAEMQHAAAAASPPHRCFLLAAALSSGQLEVRLLHPYPPPTTSAPHAPITSLCRYGRYRPLSLPPDAPTLLTPAPSPPTASRAGPCCVQP